MPGLQRGDVVQSTREDGAGRKKGPGTRMLVGEEKNITKSQESDEKVSSKRGGGRGVGFG